MPFSLDAATELTPVDANTFRVPVDETWWNFQSAFGGWAAALASQAVRDHADCRGELASLNAIFPAALGAGMLTVKVERLISRARTDFWRVTFFHDDKPESLAFSADIVMTKRRTTDLKFEQEMPNCPAPEDVPSMPPEQGPVWMKQLDQRMFKGKPFSKNLQPLTRTWLKFADDRPYDTKAVIALVDSPMPRVFFVTDQPRFGSTVSFSVHILASEQQIASKTGHLLLEANSAAIFDGSYDQRARLWSQDGALLAVSNQLAFFR
ncbi:MAG: thioesterase family protein [Pseudomonadota bacterium]